ncbi:TAXI family TRAP transporter solute-binding subunit [Desulfosarcina sp.]|uniref:TAXI family TRAP transporter solute-binding subunit n=1 Tax=Desulfosarcina sp. TaxID=2027861 RepID=UPI0035640255
MDKRVIVMVWVTLMVLAGSPPAVAAEDEQDFLGIITGDVKSTAHQIGMDIKALVMRSNIHLAVFTSRGSVENVYAVYQRPGNHMGLVQSDVLAFVAKVDSDPRLRLIADKIKWVYPLYNQEIHILGKGEIRLLSDLDDKRVAIGHAESGTHLTSRLIFEISGVRPRQMLAISDSQALAALKAGSIDAMVTVDGFPVERLVLEVAPADGLHLIPITHDGIRAFYPASRIPAGSYPWQVADVDTVSVMALLVAYDFRNHHCKTIGNVGWLIKENLDWLRFNGHPKWKSVDLGQPVSGWEQYSCMADFTPAAVEAETESSPTRKPNPVADAIEAVFRP